MAKQQIQGLEQRLNSAEIALAKLVSQPGDDTKALQTKVDALFKRQRRSEYLGVTIEQKIAYKRFTTRMAVRVLILSLD